MFRNYLKIAWRNILKNKMYSVIHVMGLALGISACMVIYLITRFEFSFDRFHPDGDRIYRIVGALQDSSGEKEFLNSVVQEVAGFEHEIPGFAAKAAYYTYNMDIKIPHGAGAFKTFDGHITDSHASTVVITWPAYFDVFSYQWLAGNAASLNSPFNVVLSENRARQYFGNIPVSRMLGRTVVYNDSLKVTVSGIVRDWTEPTDLGYTDFISISTATHSFLKAQIPTEDWTSLQPHRSSVFVRLEPRVTQEEIDARFAGFIRDKVSLNPPGTHLAMYLQPLREIHFTSEFRRGDDGDDFRKAYMPTLYVLMGVAMFILVIAAVNFINLSTAQSMQRAKEVGVRKVMGSSRKNIRSQFLTETLAYVLCATFIALVLVKPMLYVFRDYIPPGIQFELLRPATLGFVVAVILFTTLLAGYYPAKVLAGYLPALTLRGVAWQLGNRKIGIRSALIVFQFTLSLVFIIGALVIGQQIDFMRRADKGFNADAVITLGRWGDHSGRLKLFAENLRLIKGVDKVMLESNAPMGFAQMQTGFGFKGKEDIRIRGTMEIGDDQYVPFYQMRLVAGRNMVHSDSLGELVVNEMFARAMGFHNPADAVGKLLSMGGEAHPIAGVVADFHEGSFHDAITPAVILNMPQFKYSVAVKLSRPETDVRDVQAILTAMQSQWKKIYPDQAFNYSFLNESIGWLYGQEEKTVWLLRAAVSITIFISCMVLFGLAMFTAQKRAKEISIRKVLGARVYSIVTMLTKEFLWLVIVSLVLASPVAYYFSRQWLDDYVYRIPLNGWVFALAGSVALGIALLTVIYHSLKAAVTNPVSGLRNE